MDLSKMGNNLRFFDEEIENGIQISMLLIEEENLARVTK